MIYKATFPTNKEIKKGETKGVAMQWVRIRGVQIIDLDQWGARVWNMKHWRNEDDGVEVMEGERNGKYEWNLMVWL